VKIAEIASNVTTFTDIAPPQGTLYYQIEVVNPDTCYPTALKAATYFSTRSNIMSTDLISIDDSEDGGLSIWPNPVLTEFQIYFENSSAIANLSIHSMEGVELINQQIVNGARIDVSGLSSGMYIVVLKTDGKMVMKKIVKE
jgi:hypothetical protein